MKLFLYDITRLYHRRRAETPTGIDRVDLRYLLHIQKKYTKKIYYIFNHNNYLYLIDNRAINLLSLELDQRWNGNKQIDPQILQTIEHTFSNILKVKKVVSESDKTQKLAENFSEIWTLRLENAKKIYNSKIKSCNALSAIIQSTLYVLISYPKQFFYFYKRKLTQKDHTKTKIDRVELKTSSNKTIENLNIDLYDLLIQHKDQEKFYINISHHGIDNILGYTDLYTGFSVKFIFYIHDIIPISFPEYVREGDKQKHIKRMDTILSLKHSIILTNSEDSKTEILKYATESRKFEHFPSKRIIPMTIGVEDQIKLSKTSQNINIFKTLQNSIYFVTVGTIEPRKNHLLLLNLWRELVKQSNHTEIPKLIIIGKRGWENENIVDMLDRCDNLKGHVHEMSNLSDQELFGILKNSRALLFPSFTEGWGMPLVEAMTLHVPVLCSDIAVFREAGQNIAEYLSPINGEAWKSAILDYAQPDSILRNKQIEKLQNFNIPEWDKHFETFDSIITHIDTYIEK